jgi:hypothetical protein
MLRRAATPALPPSLARQAAKDPGTFLSSPDILCVFGTSGSIRLAGFELRSQVCQILTFHFMASCTAAAPD